MIVLHSDARELEMNSLYGSSLAHLLLPHTVGYFLMQIAIFLYESFSIRFT